MKILVVAESVNIEDSSGSKTNLALIQNLIIAGFTVKVLHYTRKKIDVPGAQSVAIPEKKWNLFYFLSRSQRVFTRITGFNINPIIEKFLGFSFTFFNDTKSIIKSVRKEKSFVPDFVITLSKGASFRPHYALLKCPELHSKWLAYIHDPYPFHYYPRPYNWVEPGYQFKEDFFRSVSEKSRYSAFPSLLLKEWMGSYFSNFLKTGVVIPHQNPKYIVQKTDFPSYFDVSKFNLLHAGNLMKQRSPEGLIKGFQLFLEENIEAQKEAQLLLLGPASYHTDILEKYSKNHPQIYINNRSISFDEVYYLQQHVSVNIILESKSEISPFLPAKFPHCVEANKIILLLSPYYSETKRLLGSDYEYWTEVDDVEKIAHILGKLYQLWKQDSDNLLLDRNDLAEYLSADHLKKIIIGLQNN